MPIFNPIIKKSVTPTEGWQRPADWLDVPTLTEGAAVLFAVRDVPDGNHIAFQFSGDYTVDWGDVTIENYSSMDVAEHSFFYADFDDTTLCKDYRQSMIVVTPQAGQSITRVDFQHQHPDNYSTRGSNILDIILNIPNITGSGNLGIGYGSTQAAIILDEVQRIWIREIGAVTTMQQMFYSCYS